MSRNNIVTVILTGKDEEKYCIEALDSILGQTWLKQESNQVEFYIINDGSTDEMASKISEWLLTHEQDSRIYKTHFKSDRAKNIGIIASQNEAVELFKQYREEDGIPRVGICFFDLDDIMDEKFMSILVPEIEGNISVAYVHGYLKNKEGLPFVNKHGVEIHDLPTLEWDPETYLIVGNNYVPTPSMIREDLVFEAFPLKYENFPDGISKWYRHSSLFQVMIRKGLTAKYVNMPLFSYRIGDLGENTSEIVQKIHDIRPQPGQEVVEGVVFDFVTDRVDLADIELHFPNILTGNQAAYNSLKN